MYGALIGARLELVDAAAFWPMRHCRAQFRGRGLTQSRDRKVVVILRSRDP